MDQSELRRRLREELDKRGPKQFWRGLTTAERIALGEARGVSMGERAANVLTGRPEPCPRGRERLFKSVAAGWSLYCGVARSCECLRESMAAAEAARSPESVAARAAASRAGLMKKRGVDNPSRDPAVERKRRETMEARYGSHYLASAEARDKAAATCLERYGGRSPASSEAVRAKMAATCVERYGADNPMKSTEVKARAAATCLERYGADNPSRVSSGRIGPGAAAALCDRGWVLERSDPDQIARELGVHRQTAVGALRRFGVEPAGSALEAAVRRELERLGKPFQERKRVLPGGLEVDFLFPAEQLAIEVHGLYWHSEIGGGKGKWYHLKKLEAAQSVGLRLVQVFHDEWCEKKQACVGRVAHALGLGERGPGARELTVERVPWSAVASLYEERHLQGPGSPCRVSFALVDGDGKVRCAASFSPPRRPLGRSSGLPELTRFCTDGLSYAGALSRLTTAYLRESGAPGLLSYADRRWSAGGVYSASGFSPAGATRPNYWYTRDYSTRLHRFSLTKRRLVEAGGDPELSEGELALAAGYDRVWDCGSLRFELKQ